MVSGRGHGTGETKVCEEDFRAQTELWAVPRYTPETEHDRIVITPNLMTQKCAQHQSTQMHIFLLFLYTQTAPIVLTDFNQRHPKLPVERQYNQSQHSVQRKVQKRCAFQLFIVFKQFYSKHLAFTVKPQIYSENTSKSKL